MKNAIIRMFISDRVSAPFNNLQQINPRFAKWEAKTYITTYYCIYYNFFHVNFLYIRYETGPRSRYSVIGKIQREFSTGTFKRTIWSIGESCLATNGIFSIFTLWGIAGFRTGFVAKSFWPKCRVWGNAMPRQRISDRTTKI